jgi:CRISPR-associated exonuclease Cas4
MTTYTLCAGRRCMPRLTSPASETAKGVRVERALPLWHDALGLVGKSDVVEFLAGGVPYPVEYKHGSRNKAADIAACDDIQLAAQAMCLEAMTGKPVSTKGLCITPLPSAAGSCPSPRIES